MHIGGKISELLFNYHFVYGKKGNRGFQRRCFLHPLEGMG